MILLRGVWCRVQVACCEGRGANTAVTAEAVQPRLVRRRGDSQDVAAVVEAVEALQRSRAAVVVQAAVTQGTDLQQVDVLLADVCGQRHRPRCGAAEPVNLADFYSIEEIGVYVVELDYLVRCGDAVLYQDIRLCDDLLKG
ncbi:hypothetical protein D3C81_1731850 [compost metagenome]